MNKADVTILGAGLCGALLSIVLARRNLRVRVLERAADPRVVPAAGGRSINLAMAARGIAGLRYAGVFADLADLLLPMKGRRIHDMEGNTQLHRYGQRDDEVIFSVSRNELNNRLIDLAEKQFNVQFAFGFEATRYDYEAQELTFRFPDGSGAAEKISPLIAADGAGSVVRRAFENTNLIRGVAQKLDHRYKELTLTAADNGDYLMDAEALHVWPRGGFMLIALPNLGGSFTLTLFMPVKGEPGFDQLDSEHKINEFFAKYFADIAPDIQNLAGDMQENPTGVLGTVRCEHWHLDGKLLLIGDAAHAVVPFHGQGMNLTFEDCAKLDQALNAAAGDWEDGFRRFERVQMDNANAIADMALENYIEMRDTVRDPKHRLKQRLSFELERRLPDRFIPRYSMVMFRDNVTYATAKARGEIQSALLDQLTDSAESIDDIDLEEATELVKASLPVLTPDQSLTRG